jgi:hypothetical protein
MPGRSKGKTPASKAGGYKKGYTKDQIEAALDQAWNDSNRLRANSDGGWTKAMWPVVKKAAAKHSVPATTLKDHFRRRFRKMASGVTVQKVKADARGQLKSLEMKALYDWIEFMRQKILPPTRDELRYQVTPHHTEHPPPSSILVISNQSTHNS